MARRLGTGAVGDVDAGGVDADHPGAHPQLHAEALELLGRLAGQLVAEGGQRLLATVEQDHPHRRRVEGAELAPQAARRQLPNLAGELHPGRSGPDDRDGQPSLPLGRVIGHLGHLEGAEDPAPQLHGVVDGLHAGRVEGELVVTEVRLVDTGGHDQAVVWDLELRDPRTLACTTRRSRSNPVTSASSTRTFLCLRTTCRIGGAI